MLKRKCSQRSDFKVSEITEEQQNINLHGVITNLSPVKKGKRASYFSGRMKDENAAIRLVCFTEKHYDEFRKFAEGEVPVKLSGARIQSAKFQKEGYEVIATEKSVLERSDMDIAIPCASNIITQITNVKAGDLDMYNVHIKVLKVEDVCEVATKWGKTVRKQEVLIADESDTATLVIWNSYCGSLLRGKYYIINNLTTEEFNGIKNFKFSDLTEVREAQAIHVYDQYDCTGTIQCVKVSTVLQCIYCTGKLEPLENKLDYSRCNSCKGLVKSSAAKITRLANIAVKTDEGKVVPLQIDEKKIAGLTQKEIDAIEAMSPEDIEIALLEAEHYH